MFRAILIAVAMIIAASAPAVADCATPEGYHRVGSSSWRMANVGFQSAPGFERLPTTLPADIPQVIKDLGRMSSGRAVHIRTDASSLHICFENAPGSSYTNKWTQDGMRGGDIYYRKYGTTEWHWLTAVHAIDPDDFEIAYNMGSSADREFLIYLPSYARVLLLRVEVPTAATVTPGPTPMSDPLVFLGTSITQGANGSRPGLTYVAEIGRMLDRDAINLGFSGSCNLYAGFADLLDDIAASAYVIDCFQNMTLATINAYMYDFGDALAEAVYPAPVIFIEQAYDQSGFGPGNASRQAETAAAHAVYEDLALVHSNVFWIETDDMLGDGDLATSDGIHPNDLGHYRMAVFLRAALDAMIGL